MPTINGKDAVVFFKKHDGTATLSGLQRTIEIDQSIDTADHTAGTMNYRRRKATVGDISISITSLYNAEDGTAIGGLLVMGAEGTLEIAPSGTATGNPKGQYPVVVTGVSIPIPYDGEVTQSWSFEGNGDPVTEIQTDVY